MLNKAIKKVRENKKGFTLAELLIVVAIIAVLVAISIPIFTSQLEKSRQATDAANLRAEYAEAATASLDNNGEGGDSTTGTKIVSNGTFDKMEDTTINNQKITSYGTFTKGQTYYCHVDKDGKITFSTSKTASSTPSSEANGQ